MTTINIQMGALAPSISKQCVDQDVVPTGMKMKTIDRINNALTLAKIHGVLTDAECYRARNRLLKLAKFKQKVAT